MKHAGYVGSLVLVLAAMGVLLIRGSPVEPTAPVQLHWPATSATPPPMALHSVRTMNETAFFKVLGVLHNRGAEPIGPVVVRGCFANRSNGTQTMAMAFTLPEIIVPGATARFELVVPELPETSRVDVDFRLLSGDPLPVDGTRTETDGKGAP